MTDHEAAEILFAIALAKREHADDLRDAGNYDAVTRSRLLDQQADALDLAIERLGGLIN